MGKYTGYIVFFVVLVLTSISIALKYINNEFEQSPEINTIIIEDLNVIDIDSGATINIDIDTTDNFDSDTIFDYTTDEI